MLAYEQMRRHSIGRIIGGFWLHEGASSSSGSRPTVVALCGFLFMASAFLFTSVTPAAAQQKAAPPLAQAAPINPQAKTLLLNMAEHLSQAKAFSVSIDDAYDVVQASGQKIEFGETYHVLLSRPDKLRIEFADRDGSRRQIIFDGKTMTMASPGEPFYSSLTKPGSVDQLVDYVVNGLDTPIPLSMLLVTTAPKQLDKRITAIALVGDETIAGIPVYHIAARTTDLDFQIWITKTGKPVPVRVVITYTQAAGQPQFSAKLSDWNFVPATPKSSFVFVPPQGARPIAIAVPEAATSQSGGENQ